MRILPLLDLEGKGPRSLQKAPTGCSWGTQGSPKSVTFDSVAALDKAGSSLVTEKGWFGELAGVPR